MKIDKSNIVLGGAIAVLSGAVVWLASEIQRLDQKQDVALKLMEVHMLLSKSSIKDIDKLQKEVFPNSEE